MAAQLGMHEATIARWIGLPSCRPGRRPAGPKPIDALIRQLIEEKGMTFAGAGKMVGLSPSGAWRRYARSVHPLSVRLAADARGAGREPNEGLRADADPCTRAAANDDRA
jgi:hypothetical protein